MRTDRRQYLAVHHSYPQRQLLALLAVVSFALITAGCTKPPSDAAARGAHSARVVNVVAAENFWGSIARQLGGKHARVTSIISSPATDPHDYEPTATDGRTVASANLLIVNGADYDTWATHLEQANGQSSTTQLNIGQLARVPQGGNPHLWYSPTDVQRAVSAITAAYVKLDPSDSSFFKHRKAQFESTGLAEYHSTINQIRRRYAGTPVGISESIFVPMARALGLDVVTPSGFYDAIAEGADPTAQDKETIDRHVATEKLKVWVYNSQNATPDVQQITDAARAKGIPVVAVTETLKPASATFQAWQVTELQHLDAALNQATGGTA